MTHKKRNYHAPRKELGELEAFHYFDDVILLQVVTLAEAVYLWQKHRSTIMNHVYKGRLSARRSLTNGDYLITYVSLYALFGKPVHNPFEFLYEGGE